MADDLFSLSASMREKIFARAKKQRNAEGTSRLPSNVVFAWNGSPSRTLRVLTGANTHTAGIA
jgi:hypothetical protein